MKKALGIDIGGTKISYCIVNENGEIISEIKKKKTPDTAEDIFKLLKEIAQENNAEINGIGIATAGAVNIDNTRVMSSTPNLPDGYKNIDFSLLSDKKVFVENDANAAVWAEYKCGAAKNTDYTLIITLGTGIGAGLVADNKLYRGKSGAALEAGSMKIFADKRQKCTCGRYDCWESYASGTGLKNCARSMAKSSIYFKTSFLSHKNPDDLTSYDVIEGVKKNDEFSKKVFEQWEEYIYVGLVSLTDIFDPACIVISGGMGEFVNIKKLEEKVNEELVVPSTKIKLAEMKNNAGMVGAALLAIKD